jgi:outer membrane protein TolC
VPELGIGRDELGAAVAGRADVVAAARQAEAANANQLLAESGRQRDVSVNGIYGRSRLSQDLPTSSRRLDAVDSFGLSVSVPIFTGRIVRGNVGIATAQAGQAQAAAQAALLQARAEFAAAWAAYRAGQGAGGPVQRGGAEARRGSYRSTEQAYLAGGRGPARRAGRAADAQRHPHPGQPSAPRLPAVLGGARAGERVSGVAPRL